jgi:hypothetical protein
MSLILSIIHPAGIIMAADSRKTLTGISTIGDTVTQFISFEKKRKLFHLKNIGCIGMWGDFTSIETTLSHHLTMFELSNTDVTNLADSLLQFLKKNINKDNNDDIGFHIAGYNVNNEPKLYHVFFGKDRGPDIDQNNNRQDFKKYDHSNFKALYNGNNTLGHMLIDFTLKMKSELGILKWLDEYPINISKQFAKILIEQVSKVDNTVGDDIIVATISKNNSIDINIDPNEQISDDITAYVIPSGINGGYNTDPTGSLSQ